MHMYNKCLKKIRITAYKMRKFDLTNVKITIIVLSV